MSVMLRASCTTGSNRLAGNVRSRRRKGRYARIPKNFRKTLIDNIPFSMPDLTNRKEEQPHWYALWVYRGLVIPVTALCVEKGIRTYRPMRLVEQFTDSGLEYKEEAVLASLLFVRTTPDELAALQRDSKNRSVPYCYPGTRIPAPIADRDMEIFMLVVKHGAAHVEQVEFPIDRGDRVRVIDGMFKGAEGYIRRVHGSRRFVVALEGVVAIAVTHIPRQYLERVEPSA